MEKRNLLLWLRYLGTRYHGFQVQQNAPSVAEALQDAIEQVLGTREDIKGCSRTDAGVHALCYAVSLRTASAIPPVGLQRALNAALPQDIAVTGVQLVPGDFHARYSCIGKTYRYTLLSGETRDPFLADRSYHIRRPLDLTRMQAAADKLLGRHDFASFAASGGKVMESTERTITRLSIERSGPLVEITVSADGFLYKMVRTIVGTLIEVSDGRLEPEALPAILAARDRKRAGFCAPAAGLCLIEVRYPPEALAIG